MSYLWRLLTDLFLFEQIYRHFRGRIYFAEIILNDNGFKSCSTTYALFDRSGL